jgi:hypothetical protein
MEGLASWEKWPTWAHTCVLNDPYIPLSHANHEEYNLQYIIVSDSQQQKSYVAIPKSTLTFRDSSDNWTIGRLLLDDPMQTRATPTVPFHYFETAIPTDILRRLCSHKMRALEISSPDFASLKCEHWRYPAPTLIHKLVSARNIQPRHCLIKMRALEISSPDFDP